MESLLGRRGMGLVVGDDDDDELSPLFCCEHGITLVKRGTLFALNVWRFLKDA